MTSSDTLQALMDRQAITELIYRYCRSVDRLDIPLGQSIWHEDGYADYGEWFYQGPGKEMMEFICTQHRNMPGHSHQIANTLIHLDGDQAGSESYVTVSLRMNGGGKLCHMTVWGRYIDCWSRRDGRWGLMKRTFICDFDETRDVHETEMEMAPRRDTGKRDTSDPSYAVLGHGVAMG